MQERPITFQTEFPDFPTADMPKLPEGFENTSWHNNSAPSSENRDETLLVPLRLTVALCEPLGNPVGPPVH